jgi:hypothetical protein
MSLDAPQVGEISRERVRWLWPGRIPFGKVSVIDGDPGLGKSTVMLDLIARVSTASPLPDGNGGPSLPMHSIILSAEDSISDTIRPRLEAHGANLDRVTVFRGVNDREGPRPPELPGDLDRLAGLMDECEARLVTIDPLMAFLAGAIDAHRDQDVRHALHALAVTAERTEAAFVIVRHLNKMPGGSALYRGGGSIGIIGAARAGMVIAPDPSDENRRVLAVTKSNLAVKPPSLAYRLVPHQPLDCARVKWEGEIALSADALLNPPRETKRDEAAEFLEDALADGPQPARTLFELAEDNGISEKTLRRAKSALDVEAFRRGKDGEVGGGAWWWKLPGLDGQDLDGQPLSSQMATLKSAGQEASSNGSKIKVANPECPGESIGGEVEAPLTEEQVASAFNAEILDEGAA